MSPDRASGGDGGASPPHRWRVHLDPPAAGARNMALDHGLARSAGAAGHEGRLRLYAWLPATVSFGRNEPVPRAFPRRAEERDGVGVVRRPTGGRAVLHDDEVTYALAVPADGGWSPRTLYRAVHDGIASGLRALGVPAEVVTASAGRILPPDAGPCFGAAAPGEIAVGGRKLVGSAQARLEGALLQHGSLRLSPGRHRLAELLGPGAAAEESSAFLRDFLPAPPTPEALAEALVDGLSSTLGGAWEVDPSGVEEPGVHELEERYRSPTWTWRR